MSKQNLILTGLLLGQVLLILGMRLGGGEETLSKPVTVLEGYDADKVTKIEILGAPKDGDGPDQSSITLSKSGATWGVATADDFPADQQKVKDFLATLGKMKSRSTVVTSSKYHEKLEVAPDKYQRKVTITQDGKEKTFYVGTSPSFKNLHIRVDGQDDVLLVNEVSTGDFSDRAWGWVDRKYVKHDKKNVWAVKIENQKGKIELEKNPQDDTWIAAGLEGAPKKTTVDDLVRKASQINLEEPVGKQVKPEYELGKLATVTLVTGTSTVAGAAPPSTETTTIQIGKKLESENRYYVKSSKNDYVIKAASWAIEPLVQKTKADLVDEKKDSEKK